MYSSGNVIKRGTPTGDPTHDLTLASSSEIITEVLVRESQVQGEATKLAGICFATSTGRRIDTAGESNYDREADKEAEEKRTRELTRRNYVYNDEDTDDQVEVRSQRLLESGSSEEARDNTPPSGNGGEEDFDLVTAAPSNNSIKTFIWTKPNEAQWSLRGFFSFTDKSSLVSLGIVWGCDPFVPVPNKRISSPICNNFLSLGAGLQSNIQKFKADEFKASLAEDFLMGRHIHSPPSSGSSGPPKPYFNALDQLDLNWKIRTLSFHSMANKLVGLKATYRNDRILKHGNTDIPPVWEIGVSATEFVVVKLTAGTFESEPETTDGHIGTVEFTRATGPRYVNGGLPIWPLDVATFRYLGEQAERLKEGFVKLEEMEPAIPRPP